MNALPPSISDATTPAVTLTRTVRFSINSTDHDTGKSPAPPGYNTFAAWPPCAGLGRHYALDVTCVGPIDPKTGYFMNIRRIDDAVRFHALPIMAKATSATPDLCPTAILQDIFEVLYQALDGTVQRVSLQLSPFLRFQRVGRITAMPTATSSTLISHQFEFAAAHRLHCPDLTDEENRRLFGKCNRPNGHGHNYRLEVTVRHDPDIDDSQPLVPFHLPELERIVHDVVIERFDHTNLNVDCDEFRTLNPSVENIASVCCRLLRQPLRDAHMPLQSVTVWETDKTSCTCTPID